MPPSWSPPKAPIRGDCGLAAAGVHVLLHGEADGKCHTSVHTVFSVPLVSRPYRLSVAGKKWTLELSACQLDGNVPISLLVSRHEIALEFFSPQTTIIVFPDSYMVCV